MPFCDVPIPHLPFLWPHVEPHIARVLRADDNVRYLPADVLERLLDGRARLWISWNREEATAEAAVVTEIIDYPRLRELRIWLVAGRNMRAWAQEGLRMVEAFARANDCVLVTGGMRRGWLRVGGPGYRQTGISLEKRL